MSGLFVGIPTRGQVDRRHEKAFRCIRDNVPRHAFAVGRSTLLCFGFNVLWAEALNQRANGFDRFLMVHDDVTPIGAEWYPQLEAERAAQNLDAISLAVPIKDDSGETSTAIDVGEPGSRQIRKFQVADLQGRTLTSETTPGLLINTGCLLIDLTKPWCDQFCFTTHDEIVKGPDGRFQALAESEDWYMSRWLRARGIPYGSTGKVRCVHSGYADFGNWIEVTEPKTEAVEARPAIVGN